MMIPYECPLLTCGWGGGDCLVPGKNGACRYQSCQWSHRVFRRHHGKPGNIFCLLDQNQVVEKCRVVEDDYTMGGLLLEALVLLYVLGLAAAIHVQTGKHKVGNDVDWKDGINEVGDEQCEQIGNWSHWNRTKLKSLGRLRLMWDKIMPT